MVIPRPNVVIDQRMDQFAVRIHGFSGPLDLLLLLVEQHEIDLSLLPLEKVTSQFCNYILIIEKIDMEEAIGFLILAAKLVEIKSESMLPRVDLGLDKAPEAPPEVLDCREDLLRQLEEYRRYRDAALEMMGMAGSQERLRTRKPADFSNLSPAFQPVELWDLVSAYARLLRETNPVQIEKIKEEYLPLEVLMRQTREAVFLKGRVSLADLVHMDASRSRLIGIFLAVLELIKLGGLVALQDKEFGEILLLDPDNLSSLLAA